MREWTITETPDSPADGSLGTFWAEDALGALDEYARAGGWALYSELIAEEPDGGWIGVDERGRTWATFTNTAIYAIRTS